MQCRICQLKPQNNCKVSFKAYNYSFIFHSFRENDQTLTVFQITPRMSSYLPVLIVSDFSCKNGTAIDSGINGDLPVKVFLRTKIFFLLSKKIH